ncbi:MAG TPA: DUF1499 domain-containing protein [Gammaproteobacteria bacterium]
MIYGLLGFVVVCLYLVALSIISRQAPEPGQFDGRLRACPDTPNCVSSEDDGLSSFIAPMGFQDSAVDAWAAAKNTLQAMGGTIQKEEADYLWATFITRIFRFVDDVELRMDEQNRIIHIRSASRVGRSDLGLNRKRVEEFRERFKKGEI